MNETLKNTTVIDYKYIKKLLKNWKIKDFRFNDKLEVTNPHAIEELEKTANTIIKLIPENLNYMFFNQSLSEMRTAFSDNIFQGAFIQYLLSGSIFNYIQSKKQNPTDEYVVFTNLTLNFLDNFKGFLFSYLSFDTLTGIQKMRILYESYVIFLFINKYKNLVKPFLDHVKIIENKIFRDMPGYKNEDVELLIQKYGYGFLENYGWTKDVITNASDRNLKYMATDVGLDLLDPVYKLTSNFIHTNAFSALIKKLVTPDYLRNYIPIMTSILARQIFFYITSIGTDENEITILNLLLQGMEKTFFPQFDKP
jgi:hypothetical protein